MEINSTRFYLFFLLFSLFSAHSLCLRVFHGGDAAEETAQEIHRSDFPDGFLFGAATSSYQIEGAHLEDGKSLSNWDVFSHTKGNIKDGRNGDVSDDHYHRYKEDIEIMDSLGLNAYRFSISWARVLPRGRFGEVNPSGIRFYNDIIDNLLARGIQPFVTIHHTDLPQELEDRYASWLSPQMQEDFVHFAETCFKYFGDRVKYWATINEPNLSAWTSYRDGLYPPARCSPPFGNCTAGNSDIEPLIAMHNMLLAHARAVKLYRDHYQKKQGGSIGVTVCANMYEPLTDDELDREATDRAIIFYLAWNLDPLVFGDYPSEMREYLGSDLPVFTEEEKKYLKNSIDFIGANHYTTQYIKDCLHSSCGNSGDHPIQGFTYTTGERNGVPIGERTGMPTFYIVPRGLEEAIGYLQKRYHNKPMFLSENGYTLPMEDDLNVQALLNDTKRIEFHKAYLASLTRAMRNGADVRGYFIWSLMDNFEWVQGYSVRFGLFYINLQTLNRVPKLSAKWYQDFLTNSSLHSNKEETAKIKGSYKNNNVLLPQITFGYDEMY